MQCDHQHVCKFGQGLYRGFRARYAEIPRLSTFTLRWYRVPGQLHVDQFECADPGPERTADYNRTIDQRIEEQRERDFTLRKVRLLHATRGDVPRQIYRVVLSRKRYAST